MPDYRAPLRDMEFVNKELLGLEHYDRLEGCEQVSEDLLDAILDGGAKFAEQVLAPLNRNGDEQEMEAEGLLAVCIQHEMDHLDG